MSFIVPRCEQCGDRPAICLGRYADHNADEDCTHEGCTQHRDAYACDECCGHGCEGGYCRPLELSDYKPHVVDLVGDVEQFHLKFHPDMVIVKPRVLPFELAEFRRKFLNEEVTEYVKASYRAQQSLSGPFRPGEDRVAEDLEEMLDALVDEVYVAIGTAYYHGFDFREAWRRVHEANMQKERAVRVSDSKRGTLYDVVKPPGWKAPDHSDLVADHAHRRDP